MKVLFDQRTPVPLRREIAGHVVSTAYELGWATLRNGELLAAAESAGFEAVLTTDKNLRHQQSVAGRRLGVVVLPTTDWARIRKHVDRVAAALDALRPCDVAEVEFE